jgi:predicted dehydrogenase
VPPGGVSVLCEKPPCLSLAELDRICAAERRGGAHFVTVFQHRFASSGRHIKRLVDAGAFGRPLVAICNTLWYRDQAYFAPPWRGRWDTEGGGPTIGHGLHQIDLLTHLLGEWDGITATAARLDREVMTEDMSLAHVRFASGAVAAIVNSVLSPRQETYLRLDFTGATVELTHLYGYAGDDWRLTPAPSTPPERVPLWWFPSPDLPSGHAALIGDVLARLRRGERPEPSSDSVRVTLALVTGLYAAAFTGRPVRRRDLTPASPFYHALHGGRGDPVPAAALT